MEIEIQLNKIVVNCFQIVSLTYWSQQLHFGMMSFIGCELLSDCIFDILVTTYPVMMSIVYLVVNCFQIVSLTYWSQPGLGQHVDRLRCELLSDCIFDILVTTKVLICNTSSAL